MLYKLEKTEELKNLINYINIKRVVITFFFVYFILRGIILVFTINPSIPPDELTHFKIIKEYSQHGLFTENGQATYILGDISRIPYLYYLLLGTILHLNFLNQNQLIFLRLINVFLSMITIIYIYKTSKLFTRNKFFQIFVIGIITNIPMFSFISASVNSDNLSILLSTTSIYYFFKVIKSDKDTLKNLALCVISILSGFLTKISFLPVGLLLVLLLLLKFYKNFPKFKNIKPKSIINVILSKKLYLFVIIIFLLMLNLRLYAVNLIKYKNIEVKCTQILTEEQCQSTAAYDRNIKLETERSASPTLNPYFYAYRWKEYMSRSIFGILGHRALLKPPKILAIYEIISIISFFGLIRRVNLKKKLISYSIIISLWHIAILFLYQNYLSYLRTDLIALAIQGRYILPIIGLLVILMSYGLLGFKKYTKIKLLTISIILTFFVYYDFIYFQKNLTEDWYWDTKVSRILYNIDSEAGK